MITFALLVTLLIAFAILTVITISVGGAAFMVIFADWIVFVMIIGLAIKGILGRRK